MEFRSHTFLKSLEKYFIHVLNNRHLYPEKNEEYFIVVKRSYEKCLKDITKLRNRKILHLLK